MPDTHTPPDLRDRLDPALADRYTIDRELGQGGMAAVYLAHDLRHDREVALKVLRPEISAEMGAERFLREIKIAAGSPTRTSCRCSIRAKPTACCST